MLQHGVHNRWKNSPLPRRDQRGRTLERSMKIKPKLKKETKKEVKKVKRVKVYLIPETTRASKAIKTLKWKLPENRTIGACSRIGCKVRSGVAGIFCKKDKKILRKEQLRLNNIPWRKKKAEPDYEPDQPHVLYSGAATKFTIENKDKAVKR